MGFDLSDLFPESRVMNTAESAGYKRSLKMMAHKQEENIMGEIGTFGWALRALKRQEKVCRRGWNGKGQFVVLMPALYLPPFNTQGESRKVNDRTAKWIGEDKPLDSQPYFALYNAQGKWQPGWVPSTSDCLAEDWEIAE